MKENNKIPKILVMAVMASFVLIGVMFFKIQSGSDSTSSDTGSNQNVQIVDNKQIITITAKGGYLPRRSIAKADIPSVIRLNTQGTFDCSAALVIPSLNIRKNLPPSALTDIEIPKQSPGSEIFGTCSMGMYNFSIKFN